jgi:hypothetical protein
MPRHITDADERRIKRFLTTPKYERGPHLLEPESEDDD